MNFLSEILEDFSIRVSILTFSATLAGWDRILRCVGKRCTLSLLETAHFWAASACRLASANPGLPPTPESLSLWCQDGPRNARHAAQVCVGYKTKFLKLAAKRRAG